MGVSGVVPDIGPGEVLLKNGTNGDFQHCRFVTKRRGKHSIDNNKILFPIFVEEWEKELQEKRQREKEEKDGDKRNCGVAQL